MAPSTQTHNGLGFWTLETSPGNGSGLIVHKSGSNSSKGTWRMTIWVDGVKLHTDSGKFAEFAELRVFAGDYAAVADAVTQSGSNYTVDVTDQFNVIKVELSVSGQLDLGLYMPNHNTQLHRNGSETIGHAEIISEGIANIWSTD